MKRNAFLLIAGGLLCVALTASATTRYVNLNNPAPASPYTNWITAATNIQAAVDAAVDGDEILVASGVYATGGRAVYGTMTNRVAIDKAVTVRSTNGPLVTVIKGAAAAGGANGDGAIRCVYVGTGAVLSGFTLTNGHTRSAGDYAKEQSGGGAWCEVSGVVSNCTLSGNSASWFGGGASDGRLNNCTLSGNSATGTYGSGGGAYSGTLNNCTLSGNSASVLGGGAFESTLNNCTLNGNSASEAGGGAHSGTLNNCTLSGNSAILGGGGVAYGTLNNCIVYYNSAPNGPNYFSPTFNYSCTTPLPAGAGNFATEPLYVDTNGWSNLRLQANSPCINAGNNAYVGATTGLDGQPRLAGGTVDLGAYEFQGTGLTGFTGWLWEYGLRIDGTSDCADTDHDGHNNWQEWRCQTDPTNALSALRLSTASPAGTDVVVTWQSEAGVSYYLLRSTNLWAGPPFRLLATNLVGQAGTTTHTDTNAAPLAPLYYRVGVGD